MKSKIFLGIFTFFLIFLVSFNVSAYTDYAMTDIALPNTVRAGQDLNVTFVITSNQDFANLDVNVEIYSPSGDLIYDNTIPDLSIGANNELLSGTASNLLFSTQPYLIRATIISSADDNPSNNMYSKYFTVSKASNKVPVSDLPLFSGILIALLFLFVFSFKENKKSKK